MKRRRTEGKCQKSRKKSERKERQTWRERWKGRAGAEKIVRGNRWGVRKKGKEGVVVGRGTGKNDKRKRGARGSSRGRKYEVKGRNGAEQKRVREGKKGGQSRGTRKGGATEEKKETVGKRGKRKRELEEERGGGKRVVLESKTVDKRSEVGVKEDLEGTLVRRREGGGEKREENETE
ncbi:hypothetical protein Tco_0318221 [Tanacetum coccineum]